MSEQVLVALIALGSAVVGGILGFLGSQGAARSTIEANRKKDNYEIQKSSAESQIRRLSSLRRSCDSYVRVGFMPDDPKQMVVALRELVVGICDVLAEDPWTFSKEIRGLEDELRRNLLLIDGAFNDAVRPLMGNDLQVIMEAAKNASRQLQITIDKLSELAAEELDKLIAQRNRLIKEGIRK